MDPSILEKHKDHIAAFFAGAVAFSIGTWLVADSFRTREVAVLEREKAELQRRLSETEAVINSSGGPVGLTAATTRSLTASGRQELESLIYVIDVEIASKKEELARHSAVTVGDPQPESYKRIEEELRSLQEQRDQARRRLIQAVVE